MNYRSTCPYQTRLLLALGMMISLTSRAQIRSDFEIDLGYPRAISNGVHAYLVDSLGLSRSISSGVSIGGRLIGKNDWFFSVNGVYSTFAYKKDATSVAIGQRFAMIGVGKEFQLSDKIYAGTTVQLGIMRSVQTIWNQSAAASDIWDKFALGEFEQVTQLSPIKFATQVEIHLDYKIHPSINLIVGLRNSIIPMRTVDSVHGIDLYGNYSMPFIGIRYTRDKK